jgi:hypothetical protein
MTNPAPATPPNQPTDTPMERVVERLDAEGFDGQFRSVEGGAVQCLTCRVVSAAGDLRMDDVTRLEGVSDPADMAVVLPLRCPACGTRGTLVVGYGPNATAEEAEVLRSMSRQPAEGSDCDGDDVTPGIGRERPTGTAPAS